MIFGLVMPCVFSFTFQDEESWTPLHSCASRGAGALVAKLLEASADAEAQTSSGGAALHFAASKGHEEAGVVWWGGQARGHEVFLREFAYKTVHTEIEQIDA